MGYSFGYLMGKSNADSLQGIDLDAFSAGLKAAAAGKQATLSEEDMARVLTQFKRQAEAKELITLKKQADENAKIGQAFLAENAKKTGDQNHQIRFAISDSSGRQKVNRRAQIVMSVYIMKAV